jgi:restriction endonuclease Mrr
MDFREKRLGLNEAIFREVNERLESLADHFRLGETQRLDLVCECRKSTCAERISMSRGEYEAVRSNDTHFALYPGHSEPEIERVISSHEGYEVVAKEGPAAEVARELSPRT